MYNFVVKKCFCSSFPFGLTYENTKPHYYMVYCFIFSNFYYLNFTLKSNKAIIYLCYPKEKRPGKNVFFFYYLRICFCDFSMGSYLS